MRRRVVEAFPITGRGLAVVLDAPTGLPMGRELVVRAGSRSWAATKEWLLRRKPEPHEEEALLLAGAEVGDVAVGEEVRIRAKRWGSALSAAERSRATGLAIVLLVLVHGLLLHGHRPTPRLAGLSLLPVALPWLALIWRIAPWRTPLSPSRILRAALLFTPLLALGVGVHVRGLSDEPPGRLGPLVALPFLLAPLAAVPEIGGPWRDRRLQRRCGMVVGGLLGWAPALLALAVITMAIQGGFDLPAAVGPSRDGAELWGLAIIVVEAGLGGLLLLAVGAALALYAPRPDLALLQALEAQLQQHASGWEQEPGPTWRAMVRGRHIALRLDMEGRPPVLHLDVALPAHSRETPALRAALERHPGSRLDGGLLRLVEVLDVQGLGLGRLGDDPRKRATHRLDDLLHDALAAAAEPDALAP